VISILLEMKEGFKMSFNSQKMSSRERVIAALNLEEPDRVPWVEKYVHYQLASQLLGHKVTPRPGERISPKLLEILPLDNLSYNFQPPTFIERQWTVGDASMGKGLLHSWDDLEYFKKKLPNPEDEKFYEPAQQFIKKYKKDYAVFADTAMGLGSAYVSMGIEHFSLMLYDEPKFVEAVLDMFADWSAKVTSVISEIGFDVIVISDDLAGRDGPLFSPQIIRDLVLPRYKKVVSQIKIPWILHSDGNIHSLMDDILPLGMKGIANLEPGPMDIVQVKKDYGGKVCLMGNIDLHYTLTRGTPWETKKEVKQRIRQIGPGGGYLLASSNGLTAYCKPENVRAMAQAVLEYGNYPIVV